MTSCAQHTADVVTPDGKFMTEEAKNEIIAKVALPIIGELADKKTRFTVNGTGKFLVAGPQADSGLTGRKIIVDTYGGWAVHGGGAFSGKDPTKVDRSAGYMARYIAKNLVASELSDECLVQLAYCIGRVDPVSVMVNTYGTGKRPDTELASLVRKVFPLSPRGMIDHLRLRQPIFVCDIWALWTGRYRFHLGARRRHRRAAGQGGLIRGFVSAEDMSWHYLKRAILFRCRA
jgi:S-adenosylmethionine synthetase